ncbi:hypothetical protein CROQUDRAFT_528504 [Cronartium quercuum f. sp. fusiforme G11]|uniref:Uncharacterized protein n=1 Tax=Cronartium quercuum f. sp. fusiforme G11 TaxID=708437 RepID=A0A9P6TBI1_9BASI|nr:hypothetical protein CROQUDRAFT_528504 [Cronartium quercuum f. sp. fusiforme G11]
MHWLLYLVLALVFNLLLRSTLLSLRCIWLSLFLSCMVLHVLFYIFFRSSIALFSDRAIRHVVFVSAIVHALSSLSYLETVLLESRPSSSVIFIS